MKNALFAEVWASLGGEICSVAMFFHLGIQKYLYQGLGENESRGPLRDIYKNYKCNVRGSFIVAL